MVVLMFPEKLDFFFFFFFINKTDYHFVKNSENVYKNQ